MLYQKRRVRLTEKPRFIGILGQHGCKRKRSTLFVMDPEGDHAAPILPSWRTQDAGQGIEYVADHLGHKNIQNTCIYAQITTSLRQEVFAKLERHPKIVRVA